MRVFVVFTTMPYCILHVRIKHLFVYRLPFSLSASYSKPHEQEVTAEEAPLFRLQSAFSSFSHLGFCVVISIPLYLWQ